MSWVGERSRWVQRQASGRFEQTTRTWNEDYRHYSPKASVLLFEAGASQPTSDELKSKRRIGIIRTKSWDSVLDISAEKVKTSDASGPVLCGPLDTVSLDANSSSSRLSNLLRSVAQHQIPHADHYVVKPEAVQVWEINLGAKTEDILRRLVLGAERAR
ncbi:unnamed protein product [Alternaria alternata]